MLQAINDGNMLFAIDQQQYLQGYLPIVLLTLYKTNLNTIANAGADDRPRLRDQGQRRTA